MVWILVQALLLAMRVEEKIPVIVPAETSPLHTATAFPSPSIAILGTGEEIVIPLTGGTVSTEDQVADKFASEQKIASQEFRSNFPKKYCLVDMRASLDSKNIMSIKFWIYQPNTL